MAICTASTASDGGLSPPEAYGAYRAAGYDFACVTDRFRERYGFPATDTTGAREDGFTTLLGAELHAPQTSRGVEWHILAVGLPADFAPPAKGEDGFPLPAGRATPAPSSRSRIRNGTSSSPKAGPS